MRTLDYVHEFLHKRVVILHRFYGTQLSFAIIIRLESSCGILDTFFQGNVITFTSHKMKYKKYNLSSKIRCCCLK